MIPIGVLIGVLVTGGLVAVIAGLRKSEPPPARPSARPAWVSTVRSQLDLTSTERTRALVAAGVAVLVAAGTGWVVLVLVAPVVAVGLPRLLSATQEKEKIARLEAMEEWTRSLAGVLTGAGAGLTDALTSTLRAAPGPIRPQVELLVARLQARRDTESSLRAFADDLDDTTGDLIAAALILGAKETGAGLSRILDNLADSVADQVHMRRDIEAERNGPRSQARMLTIIFSVCLAGFVFATKFGQFYRTPGGQVLLLIMVALFGMSLYWLRLSTLSKPTPRFLPASGPPGSGDRP